MPYTFKDQELPTAGFEFIDWEKVFIPIGGLSGGPPLPDLNILPKKARRTDKLKLTDYILIRGFALVSERFKQAVESLEPGAHQFSAIELQEKDGTPIEESYYIFKNCQAAPCVLRAHSEMKSVGRVRVEPNEGKPYYFCQYNKVGLSRPAVEGWHLWGASLILPDGCVFMSDELYKRFKKDRLTHFRYHEAVFFDEPWVPEENVPEYLQWMQENPEQADELERIFESTSKVTGGGKNV